VFATLIGIALNFGDIDPMQTLFLSAVTNGVVAVPMLAIMILIASRRSILGDFTIGPALRAVGWIAVSLMTASVLVMTFLRAF
jgi:Mn2+/Fe2+ NRAMP family transporter